MSHSECASGCDKKRNCIAIETNGWNKLAGQHGACYHFHDSGQEKITNGECRIDGDQKCYEKREQGRIKYFLCNL